ncbi:MULTISPECIES: thiazolylpeptide-type bacteriocin [unclassified Streptomyces]|uniref:thiazolylpeptide-type bacteriocin n=1 Tax=unclassified Streptomyces TaxID=2593676 RepID=UPI00365F5ED3
MSEARPAPEFEIEDLDLGELTVTSMRDTAALPEGGASWGSCSCQGSSSCAHPDSGEIPVG